MNNEEYLLEALTIASFARVNPHKAIHPSRPLKAIKPVFVPAFSIYTKVARCIATQGTPALLLTSKDYAQFGRQTTEDT